MTDPFDDPDYQAFLAGAAKECRCCPFCALKPCGGILQGGMCDELCRCDADRAGVDGEWDEP